MSATIQSSSVIFRTGGYSFVIKRGAQARDYQRIRRLAETMVDIKDTESTVRQLSLEGSSPRLKEQRRKLKRLTEKRDAERQALKIEGVLL